MPCSDQHFIPILDELRAREEAAAPPPKKGRACPEPGRRGGPRPGSGPPKGNLNALKHGRFSTRHKRLLESLLVVPEAREALIELAKHNRQRVRQAELEAAYLLMRWLATNNPAALLPAISAPELSPPSPAVGRETVLPARLGGNPSKEAGGKGPNDQTKNDQLNRALADMQQAFEKRILRKTTRKRTPHHPHQPNPR